MQAEELRTLKLIEETWEDIEKGRFRWAAPKNSSKSWLNGKDNGNHLDAEVRTGFQENQEQRYPRKTGEADKENYRKSRFQ